MAWGVICKSSINKGTRCIADCRKPTPAPTLGRRRWRNQWRNITRKSCQCDAFVVVRRANVSRKRWPYEIINRPRASLAACRLRPVEQGCILSRSTNCNEGHYGDQNLNKLHTKPLQKITNFQQYTKIGQVQSSVNFWILSPRLVVAIRHQERLCTRCTAQGIAIAVLQDYTPLPKIGILSSTREGRISRRLDLCLEDRHRLANA